VLHRASIPVLVFRGIMSADHPIAENRRRRTQPRLELPVLALRRIRARREGRHREGFTMPSYRPTITGTRHMVAAGHHAAAHAGFTILEAGGNAIDAGVAAGIAVGVLQTDRVNFAGVAPIMLYLADRREVLTLDGLGTWPRAASVDFFIRQHGGKIPPASCAPSCRPPRIHGSPRWKGSHDEFRRGRRSRDALRPRRISDARLHGRLPSRP